MLLEKTTANLALISIAIVSAVNIIKGALTNGRIPLQIAFCKIVTSLVSRVTNDEVLK